MAKKLHKADKVILKAKKESKNSQWQRVCPKCGSGDVALKTFFGEWNYICKKCSYEGAFPEQKKKSR